MVHNHLTTTIRNLAGHKLHAVIISSLGLFGLSSFTVERRTREIGIRKALGAKVGDILRLLAWQVSRLVLIAWMTVGVHAARVARANPILALRHE